ncbi:IPT/TIG domain-containing protein [Longimicrobium terrae]|uniref:IPT/TIG domain-containing protein n=1 Tax=Longimicrobium terrae TaxID=1639882 RepID=A0A841H1A3_9BACT|nr:IPT/TIG domain-containing protein [Longimicrobium terrae]MBB4637389.1 hypothetical protein [Longimicrobium terrae]MBB6071787.1 hypothetical protein [Longimicrobium terrae]NNC28547.1 IPT/TIG domain-containing protein [Longimicrobium terrae]
MDNPILPRASRTARAGAALLLLAAAAACADSTDSGQKRATLPGAEGALGVLTCRAMVADKSVECFADGAGGVSALLAPGSGPSRVTHTYGGQGSYVRLASDSLKATAGAFEFRATVQNLASLAMGTTDGSTPESTGLRVFFHTGPAAFPAGSATVANPDGVASISGEEQPYFQYSGTSLGADGILASGEVSTPRRWIFNLDPGVTSFTFQVYVQTETPAGETETVAPQVTDVSAASLVPGAAITLTGYNFNATPASNTVRIGGATATVTGGSSTQLSVIVPCVSSGTVGIDVQSGGMRGVAVARPLQVTQRTLGVGESFIITNAAEVPCNELTATGVQTRYLVSVFSNSTSPSSNSPFTFAADGSGEAPAVQAPANVSAPVPAGLTLDGYVAQAAQRAADDRHADLLEKNRVAYERGMAKFRGDPRMRANRSVVSQDPAPTRTFRVSNINVSNICNSYYVVSATRVYFDGKIAIYEDDATPDAFKSANSPAMAANYQKIGDQFNNDMEPILRTNFGDILRRDAETDNNGVLIALFTPRINNSFSGVAGYVVSCDQFPNDDANTPAVGGPYTGTGTFGASNFGEFFYAYQPVVNATGYSSGNTPDNWYRTIRSTFIHEAKHVASNSARVANNAPSYEAAWLEEGLARHSEELWMRNAVDNVAWKANTGYGSASNPINLYCDVRPAGFAECDGNTRRPASIMQRHFSSMYTTMFGQNARLLSPFGATASDNASYWYANSWSLVRYAIDRYGSSDADFLTALTQSTTSGATNLTARAGTSLDNLLGGWALSLAADDYPGLTTSNNDIKVQTWNLRSIYAGLNADLPGTYTLPYPLTPQQYAFGSFTATPITTTMRGGGMLWYEISGTQTKAQLLKLSGNGGGALPGTLRVAVARLQ